MKINFVAPFSDCTGYGLAGANLAIELSTRIEVNLCSSSARATFGKPIEADAMVRRVQPVSAVDPTLPTLIISDCDSPPPGSSCVLYTCLDTERLPVARRAQYRRYDGIIAMGTWFRDVLRREGFDNAQAAVQGFDPGVFFPQPVQRRVHRDRFLFFSGGKLEYRKGQDLVIAAYRVLQQRHADVMLVASWYNVWPDLMQSIALSEHIRQVPLGGHSDVGALLEANGLDMDRVVVLDPIANVGMPYVYRQCDCGVFPTRAEPANNQVLTEFMACGGAAIASDHTGHTDVLRPGRNSLALTRFVPVPAGYLRPPLEDLGCWYEPDLDELIEGMEYAYRHRDRLREIGKQAAADMHATRTWSHTADDLIAALENALPERRRRGLRRRSTAARP